MPRFGLATLNHSPLHGLPTQWQEHLDAAASAGFDALAPDIFWLRALEKEGVSLETIAGEMLARGLACMEIAGIAIGSVEATRPELEEIVRYANGLDAELVNARIVGPIEWDNEGAAGGVAGGVVGGVVESVRACAEAFGAVGTKVALEFSRGTTLRGVPDGQRLIEAAQVEGLGLTLDTWHFFLAEYGPNWAALEALPIEWLANVQLSDGVPYDEGRFGQATMDERRLPGEGEFDLARCARSLAQRGFDGAIVVEVLNADWRTRSIGSFASAALAAARENWAAILSS